MSKPPTKDPTQAELATLRREIEDLKRQLRQVPSRFPVGAAGDGRSIRMTIDQSNSFSPGDVIWNNGGTWQRAQANAAASSAKYSGVVEEADSDSFVVVLAGRIELSLSPGTTYYLSDAVAGQLITRGLLTAGALTIPVVRAISATEAIVLPGRDIGSDLSSLVAGDPANGGGELVVNLTSTTRVTIDDTDGVVIDLDTVGTIEVSIAGVVTITYPSNNTVTIDPSHFVGTNRAVRLREIDVCDAGVEKKMLVLCSATYT